MKDQITVTITQLARLVTDSYENEFNRVPLWAMLDDLYADCPMSIGIVPTMIHSHRRGEEAEPHLRSVIVLDGRIAAFIDNSFAGLRCVLGETIEARIRAIFKRASSPRLVGIDSIGTHAM